MAQLSPKKGESNTFNSKNTKAAKKVKMNAQSNKQTDFTDTDNKQYEFLKPEVINRSIRPKLDPNSARASSPIRYTFGLQSPSKQNNGAFKEEESSKEKKAAKQIKKKKVSLEKNTKKDKDRNKNNHYNLSSPISSSRINENGVIEVTTQPIFISRKKEDSNKPQVVNLQYEISVSREPLPGTPGKLNEPSVIVSPRKRIKSNNDRYNDEFLSESSSSPEIIKEEILAYIPNRTKQQEFPNERQAPITNKSINYNSNSYRGNNGYNSNNNYNEINNYRSNNSYNNQYNEANNYRSNNSYNNNQYNDANNYRSNNSYSNNNNQYNDANNYRSNNSYNNSSNQYNGANNYRSNNSYNNNQYNEANNYRSNNSYNNNQYNDANNYRSNNSYSNNNNQYNDANNYRSNNNYNNNNNQYNDANNYRSNNSYNSINHINNRNNYYEGNDNNLNNRFNNNSPKDYNTNDINRNNHSNNNTNYAHENRNYSIKSRAINNESTITKTKLVKRRKKVLKNVESISQYDNNNNSHRTSYKSNQVTTRSLGYVENKPNRYSNSTTQATFNVATQTTEESPTLLKISVIEAEVRGTSDGEAYGVLVQLNDQEKRTAFTKSRKPQWRKNMTFIVPNIFADELNVKVIEKTDDEEYSISSLSIPLKKVALDDEINKWYEMDSDISKQNGGRIHLKLSAASIDYSPN